MRFGEGDTRRLRDLYATMRALAVRWETAPTTPERLECAQELKREIAKMVQR